MALSFASADFATLTLPGFGAPYSFGVWFNIGSTGFNQDPCSVTQSAVGNDIIYAGDAVGGDPIRTTFYNSRNVDTSSGISFGAWQHGLAVRGSNSDLRSYLNGGSKGTGSGGNDLNPDTVTLAGATTAVSLAEFAIWTAALTDEEAAALGAGVSPLLIRPTSLYYYAPMIREAREIRRGATITVSGTPTVVAHPRMIYPSSEIGITHKQQTNIVRSASNSFLFGQNADLTEIAKSAESSLAFFQGTYPPFAELLASNSFAFSQDQIPFQDLQQSIVFNSQAVTPEVVRALIQSINFKQQLKAVVGNIASGRYRR